jgi:hypothetical protein
MPVPQLPLCSLHAVLHLLLDFLVCRHRSSRTHRGPGTMTASQVAASHRCHCHKSPPSFEDLAISSKISGSSGRLTTPAASDALSRDLVRALVRTVTEATANQVTDHVGLHLNLAHTFPWPTAHLPMPLPFLCGSCVIPRCPYARV